MEYFAPYNEVINPGDSTVDVIFETIQGDERNFEIHFTFDHYPEKELIVVNDIDDTFVASQADGYDVTVVRDQIQEDLKSQYGYGTEIEF